MSISKLVVFDLDGTLNRTELYAVPAHQRALHELGIYDVTDEEIIATFGGRNIDTCGRLIRNDDPEAVEAYSHQVGVYEKLFIQQNASSYEGTLEMLEGLKEKGYRTAICSNSSERYIRMVLSAIKIEHLIDEIQPLVKGMRKDETLGLLLKRLAPEKAIMVGDRVYDKEAARSNGLPFIGCLYGFRSDEVADADEAVTCAAEILDAVEKQIG